MTFGAEGATPPRGHHTTTPQKIRLVEKHVLSEATPLQKCSCKSYSQSKLKNQPKFWLSQKCPREHRKTSNACKDFVYRNSFRFEIKTYF